MDSRALRPQISRDVVSRSANLFMKGLALLLLYVFLGHPSAYGTILDRRNWYVILASIAVVPILLVWSAEVLVWRVRVNALTLEIRSLRGVLKKPIADISQLERTGGRISVAFKDGSKRVIPSILGDLDGLAREIDSRRHLS